MKCLRFDNKGEYTSLKFRRYREENGIKYYYTMKITTQQSGVVERMNRILTEKVRSLRLQASLPKSFWGDALIFTYFFVNRFSHRSLNRRLLEAVWSEKKMELGHLKVFDSPAYALVEEAEQSKLDPKSQKMIFIGYPTGVKGYLVWNSYFQKCVISRDVIFDEKNILKKLRSTDGAGKIVQGSSEQHSQ